MQITQKGCYLLLALVLLFFATGCTANPIAWLDQKIGETIFNEEVELKATSSKEKIVIPQSINDLSKEHKQKIDQWLEDNGFNRYGDPGGTFYTGGTPLFNELTDRAVDRFEYILKQHPDIFKIFNK